MLRPPECGSSHSKLPPPRRSAPRPLLPPPPIYKSYENSLSYFCGGGEGGGDNDKDRISCNLDWP